MKISWDDVWKSKSIKVPGLERCLWNVSPFYYPFLIFSTKLEMLSRVRAIPSAGKPWIAQTSLLERSMWISKSCLHTHKLKVIFDFTKPQRQPEEAFWEEQISRGTLPSHSWKRLLNVILFFGNSLGPWTGRKEGKLSSSFYDRFIQN